MDWSKVFGWLRKRDIKKAAEEITKEGLSIGIKYAPAYMAEAGEFFKSATAKHKAGDHSAAIEEFNKGMSIYTQHGGLASEDILLRLPNYLSALGRKDETWAEYYKILDAYKHYDELVRLMVYSNVYDKMRLFQQRAGNYSLAAVYSALSYVAWHKGLTLQKRHSELERWLLPETIVMYGLRHVQSKIDPAITERFVKFIISKGPTIENLDLALFERVALQIIVV